MVKSRKFFKIRNLQILGMFFSIKAKMGRFFPKSKYFSMALLVVVLGGFFLTPQPADAFGILAWGVAIAVGSLIFGVPVLSDIAKGILDLLVGFVFQILGAAITSILAFINFLLTGLVYVAKTFMEFALNFSLTASYTSGDVFNAGWPVFRDLANMGLILVLVAIGVGTMLNLRVNKNQLVPFILIAFLINFTPLLTGIIIDLGNITSRIFYDAAQNSSNALLATNPYTYWEQRMAENVPLIGNAISGNVFVSTDTLSMSIMAVAGIVFKLVLIFAYGLLAALFFGRTLALWLLVIFSPIAFLAFILPTTKKIFTSWWNNFLKWSLIALPLIFSLWLAGIFAHNSYSLCLTSDQSALENNIGTNLELNSSGELSGTSGLAGDDYATVLYPVVGEASAVCGIVAMFLAMGALFVGVSISLKSSAAGAVIITSRAKKLKNTITKKSSQWARKEAVKRGRQVGAKPLSTIGQGLQRVPGARSLGLAMQKPAVKWAQQYEEQSKKFANMTFEQMRGMLFDKGDKGAAAWAYAAKNHPDKLGKAVADNPELKKVMEFMEKRSGVRGDASMKDVAKIFVAEMAKNKVKREMDRARIDKTVKDESGRVIHKVPKVTDEEVVASEAYKKAIDKQIKTMSQKDVAMLSPESLRDPAVGAALHSHDKISPDFLRTIAEDSGKVEAFAESMEGLLDNFLEKIGRENTKLHGEIINAMMAEKSSAKSAEKAWSMIQQYLKNTGQKQPLHENVLSNPVFAGIYRHVIDKTPRKDTTRESIKEDMEQLLEAKLKDKE